MGGVVSNQTLFPQTHAILWNTKGTFLNYLRPQKRSLAAGSRRKLLKYKYRQEKAKIEHSWK